MDISAGARSRLGQAALLLPVVVTAIAVFVAPGRPQLWRDELATWSAATRPLSGLNRLTDHIDGVLEIYYRFMHGWIDLFGASTVALRMPSMLAAIGTSALIVTLGTVLGTRRAGVLAGLVYAVLPSTVRYGQEARPYALASLAATAATLLLVVGLRRHRWFWWVGYAAVLALLGALHLMALLVLAGHLVLLVGRPWRQWLGPGLAVAGAAGALIPLMLRGYTQTGAQLGSSHHTGLHVLLALPAGITGGVIAAIALAPAVVAGAIGAVRLALVAVAPVAAMAVLAVAVPVFNERYVLFVVPLVGVLAGQGLARLRWSPRFAPVLAVVLLALVTLPEQLAVRRSHEPSSAPLIDYRAAARILALRRDPGDAVVYDRRGWAFADLGMNYYLGDDVPGDVLASTSRNAVGSFWTPEFPDPAAELAGVDRVWAVVPDRLGTRRPGALSPAVRAVLARSYRPAGQWRVSGITLTLFTARPGRGGPVASR